MYHHRRHSSSPRRCSYCRSTEHDRRKCEPYKQDISAIKDMVEYDFRMYYETLVKFRFVPTSLINLKKTDAYMWDERQKKFSWGNTGEQGMLFSLERKFGGLCYRPPFRLEYNRATKPAWEAKPINSKGAEQHRWSRTSLRDDDLFLKPQHLSSKILKLEQCVFDNSYGFSRSEFSDLINDTHHAYAEAVESEGSYRMSTKHVELLSTVSETTARDFYADEQKQNIKKSIDKFVEEWYKYYNKKIKDNHFQR